jgi:cytochrome c oxidase subunit 4
MGGSHADTTKHMKSYIGVFAALFVCTILTVAVSTIDLGRMNNVVIALLIASFKASLVAMIFMHLKWESSSIIWITLALCALLFVVLMLLPVLTANGFPASTVHSTWE